MATGAVRHSVARDANRTTTNEIAAAALARALLFMSACRASFRVSSAAVTFASTTPHVHFVTRRCRETSRAA
jgi:hypothetical protein